MAEAHKGSEESSSSIELQARVQGNVVAIDIDDGKEGNNNDIGMLITGKEEEDPPIIIPLAGGSQQQGDKEEQDTHAASSSGPPTATHAAAAGGGGLPKQALMLIIGNYIERVGEIITLIGVGTMTSTIGGLFTREPPLILRRYTQDTSNDEEEAHAALILYYECWPAFFIVGLLEMCYGIWVSRNQQDRAGKRRSKICLILSAVLLVVTVCFTGAGIDV